MDINRSIQFFFYFLQIFKFIFKFLISNYDGYVKLTSLST